MKPLKYLVLGQENNPFLIKLKQKYTEKMHFFAQKIAEKNNFKLENYEFNYDCASIINNIIGGNNSAESINMLKNFDFKKEEKYDYIPNTKVKLTTDFINPYASFETHPNRKENGVNIGFGKVKKEIWLQTYGEAFAILKETHKGLYSEIEMLVDKIIPIGTMEKVHNSGSYGECIGHIYLGMDSELLEPAIQNLEAIIHETSHNKLNLMLHFDKLFSGNPDEKHYSPYRPDARPVKGVFIGVHAFTPTVYTLLKAYQKGFFKNEDILFKLITYHNKNKIAYSVSKKYAKFTNLGRDIMNEIAYTIKITDDLINELNISEKLKNSAKEKVRSHLIQVKKDYPNLIY